MSAYLFKFLLCVVKLFVDILDQPRVLLRGRARRVDASHGYHASFVVYMRGRKYVDIIDNRGYVLRF